jgi:hypothetical protein
VGEAARVVRERRPVRKAEREERRKKRRAGVELLMFLRGKKSLIATDEKSDEHR